MARTGLNTFGKGLNVDIDNSFTGDGNYIAANDITLSGDSTFLAAENIKGTLKIGTLVNSFTGESTVLGVFSNKYRIDGVSGIDCLTVITAVPSGNYTIYCYRLDTNAVITLYTEPFTTGFSDSNPVVDAVVYPENNIDILYFTDGYTELRKLRCDISTPYTLTADQISLLKRGTLATVTPSAVTTGAGSLVSGSYQFSIRYYNSTTKSYSKWTIPTYPVSITKDDAGSDTNFGSGGYNAISTKSITCSVVSSASYISSFTHYQVAVIENIGTSTQTVANLQPLTTLSSASFNFDYTQNVKIGEVAMSDIVVDLAPVKTSKTIAIKNNRLFLGNIEYWDRTPDRIPTVTGSVVASSVSSAKNNFSTSSKKGYFRDELYRFYVSYFDEYYNFSRPTKLDMSAITGNQLVAAGSDMKFPIGRGGSYTVMDGSNNYLYLNLSLTITNHPSWAKGFVVLRAKRKKKILFQTPIVPLSTIEGIDAMGNYPNTVTRSNGSGATTDVAQPSTTPMNQAGTWVPKNLFFTEARDIKKLKRDTTSYSTGYLGKKGEDYYEYPWDGSPVHAIFPPETIYSTGSSEVSQYEFENGHVLDSQDIAFLKLTHSNVTVGTNTAGDSINTSCHGTFYAKNNADYYFVYGGAGGTSPLPSSVSLSSKITGYKALDNYGEGTTLNGKYIGTFSNLVTNGLNWYQAPNNQRMGVIEVAYNRTDGTQPSTIYKTNQNTGTGIPTGFFSTHTTANPILTTEPNKFVFDKASYVEDSTYVAAVEITNVINSYDDTRYGNDSQVHDIVYTGASYLFDPSTEIPTVVSSGVVPITVAVAGGDCYVSQHAFKLSDNHYMLTNASRIHNNVVDAGTVIIDKWTYAFNTGGPTSISIPVGGKNISQVIQVVLESEYNGETTGAIPYGTSSGVVTSTAESNWRVSFGYPYNFGMLKECDQKSFTPYNSIETTVTKYPSRVLYSDQKVYNTDVIGFDVFRIANITDLEDTYRGITKLAVTGDSMFALQSQGVAYLPVDAKVIGTSDINTMSIRTDRVMDIPVYVSRQFGTQHLKSVTAKDNFVLFVDNINKAILRLSGQEIQNLTDLGVNSPIRALLSTSVASNTIHSCYDNGNRQYLFFSNKGDFCYVWDDRLQQWIGTQSYNSQNRLYGGVYFNTTFYVLGRNSANKLNVYKMYEGTPGQLFGNIITPSLTTVMNDVFNNTKTFDNIIIYSSDKMDKASVVSEKEPADIMQQVIDQDIEVDRREGAYRVAFLRDDAGARLRGTRCSITLKWKTLTSFDEDVFQNIDTVTLARIVTKYRFSGRITTTNESE